MRPTKLPKPLRTGGLALAALVLVGAGVIYTLDDGSDQAPRVELAAAKRGTVVAAVSAAGNTVDDGTRDLGFGGAGTVTKVYVKPGDKVDKGQVLARIGSAPARERYDAAKAQLAAAQEALDNAGSTTTPAQAQGQGQSQGQSRGQGQGQSLAQAQAQAQGQGQGQGQGQSQGQAQAQGQGQTGSGPAQQADCPPTGAASAPRPSGTTARTVAPAPAATSAPGVTPAPAARGGL
ncbi:biotin/lipoyl-binding protein [Streptosporangium lutulentum]